jgi:hypothetical protein
MYVFRQHFCIPQESPDNDLSGPKHVNFINKKKTFVRVTVTPPFLIVTINVVASMYGVLWELYFVD